MSKDINPRSQVFVGSSRESRRVAYKLQQNLDEDADVTVWDQNVFRLTKSNLESLLEQLRRSDFGIFVFAPEDLIRLRSTSLKAVRDNVLFELGLFMGRLGRERTFIVTPLGQKLHIPTDLLGITVGRFSLKRADGNTRAALGPFCEEVREQIEKLGTFVRKRRATRRRRRAKAELVILEALYGAKDHRVNVAHKLTSLVIKNRLHAYVGNQLGGDPCPNTPKDIRVTYEFRGSRRTIEAAEGQTLTLPGE